ncbi:flagellar biosynthesis protein FlhA [Shimia thalassica]|uniref:flagellar biosynthesis protein FlhA n=1 Tax=Shimia thalassica TaxID=1715693 RepID=UPI001C09E6F2|nr:flagellar biosynthesis protein FlhA [Shimia thalassica]MBU2942342.1 flagellar biosynthesis protein FlhA [Shimia thalassica]MDO6504270.1 flagellar biosynthesis protein FlhA [Shimia thalassica]
MTLKGNPTIFLAIALIAIIVMMILPVPAWVLDVGLAFSFALAILIFTITLFIERPLDFSTFPTVLLASLMLRLALNVSSTKLIIGQGHSGTGAAGHVIEGFASFVMGGNVFLGLVVFSVLLIVNFMVITKGAARMAEVGARFALDGMPGKQLAIDADMSAGAINHQEAKLRRDIEQQETTFFGSLDGASKFVKGDAVAGLLITLLNIVVGLIMGVTVHGMGFSTAFETYAILTVGDGLVTQIPAVIISIASALLLARGGAAGSTDVTLFKQFGAHPAALGTVGFLMFLFAMVPGLPFLPFSAGALALGGIAYWKFQKPTASEKDVLDGAEKPPEAFEKTMGDILELDDIHVEFATDLIALVLDSGIGIDARIASMRTHIATNFGLIIPEVRLTDDPALPNGTYVIRIQGVPQVQAQLYPTKVLALIPNEIVDNLPSGIDVEEPVYGAAARWVAANESEKAALLGITTVSPSEVLATHLLETIKRNFGRLLTLKSMRRILDEMTSLSNSEHAEANRKMLDDLLPDKVPMDLLHKILKLLLEERVSIRNLPLILEAVSEVRQLGNAEMICEHVRQRLGFQLVSEMRRNDGTIPLVQLAPEWEETFSSYQLETERGADIALPPDLFTQLATSISEKLSEAGDRGAFAALVTSSQRRRFLRLVMNSKGISNPVFSFEEIGLDARPALVGVVPL